MLRKFGPVVLVCVLWAPPLVQGQGREVHAAVELDALPYLTGGAFAGLTVGTGRFQARSLVARVHVPKPLVPDGFSANRITAFALLGDRFLGVDRRGWWVGGGPVLWRGLITSDAGSEAVYDSYLLNGSVGYRHFLRDHIYLSPWAGISLRVGGDSAIEVPGARYDPPLLNPEASVKVGWVFGAGN